jgi:AcrR family transcriptional regulator
MAKQLRAEQTRTTIIEAAADLFDRQGYGSTSLSEIVAQARVTKGALYFHFASKEELAHAIMELQHRVLREIAEEIDGKGFSALEVLIRITFGITEQALRGPIARAGLRLATGGTELPDTMPNPFRDWIGVAANKLDCAVSESDVCATIDTRSVAHAIVCFFVGSRLVGQPIEAARHQPRRIAEMWRIMIPALVPPSRSRYYLDLASALESEIQKT